MEPQPGVLRRRGRGRRPAVRALARLPRVREHRRSRRGRPSHRYGNPAAAAVQPPALHAQSLEEYGLLGPGHVRGLLPPAVGLDSRVRGVRRGGVALRGLPLVKLVAFFALAVFVHGPLSPFLPTAFEATLLYYARFYPPWLLALVGTAGASLAEAVNYRLVDWAAELPKTRRAAGREGGTVERRGIPARAVLDDRARHLLADPRLRRARAGAAWQVRCRGISAPSPWAATRGSCWSPRRAHCCAFRCRCWCSRASVSCSPASAGDACSGRA